VFQAGGWLPTSERMHHRQLVAGWWAPLRVPLVSELHRGRLALTPAGQQKGRQRRRPPAARCCS
jgi:hypothetical protein